MASKKERKAASPTTKKRSPSKNDWPPLCAFDLDQSHRALVGHLQSSPFRHNQFAWLQRQKLVLDHRFGESQNQSCFLPLPLLLFAHRRCCSAMDAPSAALAMATAVVAVAVAAAVGAGARTCERRSDLRQQLVAAPAASVAQGDDD